jgi:hypothetical protein
VANRAANKASAIVVKARRFIVFLPELKNVACRIESGWLTCGM